MKRTTERKKEREWAGETERQRKERAKEGRKARKEMNIKEEARVQLLQTYCS